MEDVTRETGSIQDIKRRNYFARSMLKLLRSSMVRRNFRSSLNIEKLVREPKDYIILIMIKFIVSNFWRSNVCYERFICHH